MKNNYVSPIIDRQMQLSNVPANMQGRNGFDSFLTFRGALLSFSPPWGETRRYVGKLKPLLRE
jgi:hypothetical protein